MVISIDGVIKFSDIAKLIREKTDRWDLFFGTPPHERLQSSFPKTWPLRHNGTYTKTETMTNKSVVGWSLALCGPALTFARSCAINPSCATNEHHWGKTVVTTTCARVQVSDNFQPRPINVETPLTLSPIGLSLSFYINAWWIWPMSNDNFHRCFIMFFSKLYELL